MSTQRPEVVHKSINTEYSTKPSRAGKLRQHGTTTVLAALVGMVICQPLAHASPTVAGNVISVPDDGWYQFQSGSDYSTFCQGVTSCTVPDGQYIVINHTTGQRFENVSVPAGQSTNGVSVSGNRIQWPDDGWYQVQSQSDNRSLCEGKRFCDVTPGTYRVINHTTGQRFTDIVVSGGTTPPSGNNGITLNGNTLSWQGEDWYQVQSASDYRTICEGGNSCTLEPGKYHIINHTTGVRIENFEVGGTTNPPTQSGDAPSQPGNLRHSVYSGTQAEIFWAVSTDDGRVVGYDVYRDGQLVRDNMDGRSFYDDSLSAGTRYTYRVIAIDNDGNESEAAETQLTTQGGAVNPEPPVQDALTVPAAQAPSVDGNNQVSWAFAPQDSDLTLVVEPFAEMPLASNGNPARWNDMETLGNRIFVVDEQDGRVYEITGGQPSLWFDIGDAIQSATGRSLNIDNPFHGGVRGIAFHPDFDSNGKFYTTLLEERPADPSQHHYLSDAASLNADSVLVEWTVDTATLAVDASSYREVFRVGIPEYDHPIKQIAFDPSQQPGDSDYGLLYIAHGDGSKESTTTVGGQGNNALGKILRINPLANGTSNYSIPGNNPFVGVASMLDEAYSIGHRNPHHPAFMQDGTLLVGEDGRDNIDEVNLVIAGADYGWSQREGAYVLGSGPGLSVGIDTLPANDANKGYVYPVAQFGHTGSVGASFTGEALGGGFVVENGSALSGNYFYIDFPKTGDIFYSTVAGLRAANTSGAPESLTVAKTFKAKVAFDHDNDPTTPALASSINEIVRNSDGYVNTNNRVDVRYGQGPDGELYLFSKRNNMVYKVANSATGGGSVVTPTPLGRHGEAVRDQMSAAASAAAPADCLLTASPESAPYYCFSPTDRRLMRIEQSGSVTWQFSLPGENASNHMESISFVNGDTVAIIADATPSPDDSAFDMSLFQQTGAYIGTYHIIADIENPDGVDFAGVNLDGLDLIVRTGPVRVATAPLQGYTSDVYVYGEHYSEIPGGDATQLSGWKKEGAFRARLDSRTGETLNTRLFPGQSAVQALSSCAVPSAASQPADGC